MSAAATVSTSTDWVDRLADEVLAAAARRDRSGPVVCASGLSPSGPIHLGNLREVLVPHLVAEELRARGRDCVHLLSWDDYDRFRRVPAGVPGVDESWERYVGRPLTAVPAPAGSAYSSWAEHFQAPMRAALTQLGVPVTEISQTQRYTGGAYREPIRRAMAHREQIAAVLDRYRTKDSGEQRAFSPYRPYCTVCGRDLTTVEDYDPASTALAYRCACGHAETVRLESFDHGKLVWKVDWPMRWTYEGVDFEPSGVDHSSPGSSFTVGGELVGPVFGGHRPIGPMYAFVGISGMAKMSSSRGAVPTPTDALALLEPAVLRWLYARRRPNQAFTIDFDAEVARIYDEWDALGRRVAAGTAGAADVTAHRRAGRTSTGALPVTARPLPYRTLTSVVDMTTGDPNQLLRIVGELDPTAPIDSLEQLRPRLDCVTNWVQRQLPDQQRTRLRADPDTARLRALGEHDRESLRLLVAGLAEHWSHDGLTTLVYGVPKVLAGLPPDTRPTPELKAAQRHFFTLLYVLLIGRETGPRLPTLLLIAGADRIATLLGH